MIVRTKARKAGMVWLAGILACLWLAACARGLRGEARSLVDFDGNVADVQREPRAYVGRVVRWGGRIIAVRVGEDRTDLVVLQQPLDYSDRPVESDEYFGRFIVRSEGFRDPAVFQKGRLLSVVGRIRGVESRRVGEAEYAYPVLAPLDIRLWRPRPLRRRPVFHFGFGVGGRF